MKVLIVEDELKLAEVIRDYLTNADYEVTMIHHGDDVMPWLVTNTPDIIVLDIMLPGTDGLTLCRDIRQQCDIPIIMTTARIEEVDRLMGLEMGADDYLCKPYSPRELVARVKAILRRTQTKEPAITELILIENTNKVQYLSQQIELTSVEFKLLQELVQKPGIIISRNHLMDHIYPDGRIVSDRTIDSHIKKLRKKLDSFEADHEFIRSVYGSGYKYD